MQYHQLGTSNLLVSEIAFGGMSLSGSDEDNVKLLQHAVGQGVNFFDTADLYDKGHNETLFGKAFKDRRDEVVLATKVGNQWRADGTGWDWNPRKEYIIQAVEDSLRRLQTDYIDLYQLHGGTIDDPMDEIIGAFEKLQHDGKIRYYGISSIRPNVIRAYVERSNIDSVMMQYSLLDRRPEESMFALLEYHQVSVLARGSVAKGLLAGKPIMGYLEYTDDQVQEMADLVAAHSSDRRTAGQTAIRYALQHPAVTSAVVGIRTEQQLQEAIGVSAAPELTAAEMLRMANTLPANRYADHR